MAFPPRENLGLGHVFEHLIVPLLWGASASGGYSIDPADAERQYASGA